MNIEQIYRHGNHIRIGNGWTAIEKRDGNLPALQIRKNGKNVKFYRGSSLIFSDPLTMDDKKFLTTLVGERDD